MYTLSGYIILTCLVILHLCFVSCFVSGEIKKLRPARRKSRSAIFSVNGADGDIVPTIADDAPIRLGEGTNEFLKKSLVEFFKGVKQSEVKRNYLPRTQKRTINSNLHNEQHRTLQTTETRTGISKVRNDTDTTGLKERKCKFPFIYDGKTAYQCLKGPSSNTEKKWCSLTSNYDRDMRWIYCLNDGTPVKRSDNIPSTTTGLYSQPDTKKTGKRKLMNDVRKRGVSRKLSKKVTDDLCDTCDRLPKNNTYTAVHSMQEEIDDVDKSDKQIHSLVSKEVDNFIGTVLAKHGVPDTEQKELLALNAKLSTELAQEVSCKMSNDHNFGKHRSDCENMNSSVGIIKKIRHGNKINKTSILNHTSTDELLSTEVDSFIGAVLTQHDISTAKQKEILKSIKKASTEIADQISYVVAYAKAGDISRNESDRAHGHVARSVNHLGNDSLAKSSVHAAVDNFLGLVLEKHGVPVGQQKEILDWNAQLSTDISDQVNSIVESAKVSKISSINKVSKRPHNISRINEMKSQLKPNISNANNIIDLLTNNVKENTTNSTILKNTTDANLASHEIERLPDKLEPIYKKKQEGSEKGTSYSQHPDKESSAGTLQAIYMGDDESYTQAIHEKDDAPEGRKRYDDVSSENDMEIGIDDISSRETVNDESTTAGIAPDVVEAVANDNEAISPVKIQHNRDDDYENITAYANKEFSKKPQIHSKRNRNHKKITGDENWDKYLMDDGWVPKSSNSQANSRSEEDKESTSGEREQLNEDEKTLINYVSDSIIQSVKNVKRPVKETILPVGKDSEVTYKKLDSGEKPYLIYRVQQGKSDTPTNQPGIDSVDTKSQKIIPGAKNINIIIINNRNNSLDLNDIENTIARSGDPTDNRNETTLNIINNKNIVGNSSVANKTSENVFLLVNTTERINGSGINKTKHAGDISNAMNLKHAVNSSNLLNNNNKTSNNAMNSSKSMSRTKRNNTNNSDNVTKSSISELGVGRKVNESKHNVQPSNGKDDKNISFSKLLSEYDKNLENSASLRKSGLINMNYAPEEIEIRTFGGNANGHKCMFPFIYDGDTYFNCVNINRDKPWCSITANYDKLPLWGYCNNEQLAMQHGGKNNSPTVGEMQANKQQQLADMIHNQGEELISKHSGMKTFGGNANGSRCVIPFVYDGQTHMKCIRRSDGTAWCAASHSYDIHPIWGNCCDNDAHKC